MYLEGLERENEAEHQQPFPLTQYQHCPAQGLLCLTCYWIALCYKRCLVVLWPHQVDSILPGGRKLKPSQLVIMLPPTPSPCLISGEFTRSQGLWPSGIYPLGVHPGMATILNSCWAIGRQASLLPAPGPFRPGAPLLFLCQFLEKWESLSCFLVMLEYENCYGCDILSFSLWVYPLLPNPSIRNLIMSPPNSYIDTLTPNETVYGDRAFKEVIGVKCSPKGGALIQ